MFAILFLIIDGKTSPCPQGKSSMSTLVYETVRRAYEFHKLEDDLNSQGHFMTILGAGRGI